VILDAATCWRLTGRAYVSYMDALPGGIGLLREGGWIALTGEPIASLNMAYIEDGSSAVDLLGEFVESIAATGHPAIVLMSDELAARVASQAERAGLQRADPLPLMTARIGADLTVTSTPSGYTVARVQDEEGWAAVLSLQAETFVMPIDALRRAMDLAILNSDVFDLFLATRDAVPFSTVTTATVDGVTSLWAMATPPAKQRQGAGRAAFMAALAYHRARGVERFFLAASPAGRPLYERCGFAPIGDTAMWVCDPSGR